MKPGKPLVFGTIGNKPVFGLPGNPTSAMISFEQFVRPALLKMMGHTNLYRTLVEARLAQDVNIVSNRPHLVRCKLFERDGVMMAVTTGNQSSGALRSMVLADGLMILPPKTGRLQRVNASECNFCTQQPSEPSFLRMTDGNTVAPAKERFLAGRGVSAWWVRPDPDRPWDEHFAELKISEQLYWALWHLGIVDDFEELPNDGWLDAYEDGILFSSGLGRLLKYCDRGRKNS